VTPRYYQTQTNNRDRWMISYVDILTILLIFFLRIGAQSLQQPPQKAETAAATVALATIAPAATTDAPVPPKPVPENRETLLRAQENLKQHGLDPHLEERGLVISLPQAILFSPGKDQVSPQALPILSNISDVLRGIPNEVRLVGHADAIPIHNLHFKNNWDLSTARSLRILEILSQDYGIEESRLSIASYGPYRPSGPNDTTDGRARNRRVEILILDEVAKLEGDR
jgi:chemotaxis protein MotB